MNIMNKCAKFHKDCPSDKKLSLISRARLNFRRRPFLSTTLFRNLGLICKQATSVAHFDQLFLCIFFMKCSQKMPSLLLLQSGEKNSKMTKNWNQGGSALFSILFVHSVQYVTWNSWQRWTRICGKIELMVRHRFKNSFYPVRLLSVALRPFSVSFLFAWKNEQANLDRCLGSSAYSASAFSSF